MKILHWSFVFLAIVLPISIVCRMLVNNKYIALRDEIRINNAIDTATKDAIDQIIAVSGFDYDDEFGDVINITPALAQESINTFFHTLAVNYNIPFQSSDETTLGESPYASSNIKNYFASYVPAVVVIAYDGFYVYSQELVSEIGYKYQLSSKIPYTYSCKKDGKVVYSVGYTLGNDIYFYDNINNKSYSGRLLYNKLSDIENVYYGRDENGIDYSKMKPDEIALITNDISLVLYSLKYGNGLNRNTYIGDELIPNSSTTNFLQDYKKKSSGQYIVGSFHENRRKTIIKIISECLTEEINEHNSFAGLVGKSYKFSLPEMTNDDWINSINDISVMSFVQGIPIGTTEGIYYNNFALGGSRIVTREMLYGNTYNKTDVKLFHRPHCSLITNSAGNPDPSKYNEIFLTEEDAANANYWPCQLCN